MAVITRRDITACVASGGNLQMEIMMPKRLPITSHSKLQ